METSHSSSHYQVKNQVQSQFFPQTKVNHDESTLIPCGSCVCLGIARTHGNLPNSDSPINLPTFIVMQQLLIHGRNTTVAISCLPPHILKPWRSINLWSYLPGMFPCRMSELGSLLFLFAWSTRECLMG